MLNVMWCLLAQFHNFLFSFGTQYSEIRLLVNFDTQGYKKLPSLDILEQQCPHSAGSSCHLFSYRVTQKCFRSKNA